MIKKIYKTQKNVELLFAKKIMCKAFKKFNKTISFTAKTSVIRLNF